MKHTLLILLASMLMAATIGCNPANHPKEVTAPPPPSDSIIMRSQSGYYDRASGSYINLFDIMNVIHATASDSGYTLVRLDTALAATNYHMNMQLAGVQHNNGHFDVQVNCQLNLAPMTDTTKDSSVLFIAQCNNGKDMKFDTVRAHRNDKSFTLHIDNATSNFGYYIVLWGLYPALGSTVQFQDVIVSKTK